MAIQIVPFPASPQVIPQSPQEPVTQSQLQRIIALRNQAAALAKDLDSAESAVQTALESGASVEPGIHVASLKEQFKRAVSWKDVAIRLAERLYGEGRGSAYAANVLQNTKPERSVKLIVS